MIRLTFRTVKDPSFWRPNNARFVIIWGKWGGRGGLGQGKKLLLASRPWGGVGFPAGPVQLALVALLGRKHSQNYCGKHSHLLGPGVG